MNENMKESYESLSLGFLSMFFNDNIAQTMVTRLTVDTQRKLTEYRSLRRRTEEQHQQQEYVDLLVHFNTSAYSRLPNNEIFSSTLSAAINTPEYEKFLRFHSFFSKATFASNPTSLPLLGERESIQVPMVKNNTQSESIAGIMIGAVGALVVVGIAAGGLKFRKRQQKHDRLNNGAFFVAPAPNAVTSTSQFDHVAENSTGLAIDMELNQGSIFSFEESPRQSLSTLKDMNLRVGLSGFSAPSPAANTTECGTTRMSAVNSTSDRGDYETTSDMRSPTTSGSSDGSESRRITKRENEQNNVDDQLIQKTPFADIPPMIVIENIERDFRNNKLSNSSKMVVGEEDDMADKSNHMPNRIFVRHIEASSAFAAAIARPRMGAAPTLEEMIGTLTSQEGGNETIDLTSPTARRHRPGSRSCARLCVDTEDGGEDENSVVSTPAVISTPAKKEGADGNISGKADETGKIKKNIDR